MIRLFSGTPGSGKTLHAVHVMDWYNRHKKPVVANFELNCSMLKYPELFVYTEDLQRVYGGCGARFSPDFLVSYSRSYFGHTRVKEGQILLVLDEAQLIFNARDWSFNRPWISFFTQHRKYGYDVVMIAQYDRMIERQIRSLIEYEEKHLKVSNLGGVWGLIMPLFMGRFRVYSKWYNQDKMLVSQSRASYSRRDKKLYDTFKTW